MTTLPYAPGPLSRAQVELFDQEGYLVVDDLFGGQDLQPVIDEISAEVDRRAAELVAAGELSRSYAEEGFLTRLTRISQETDKVARAMWNGVLSGPAFFHLITHPRLLDIAQQFCGPEIIASSVYRLRPKIPNHVMGPVPWHQDSGYVEPYCDRHLMLTVWLPLVDATEENGCMWVLPRAHKRGVLTHIGRKKKPYLVIPDQALPQELEPLCCPVKKGGALFLTNLSPHASFENNTDIVRWSMDLRYQSAALPTNAPISRLVGEALADPERGVPVACYPPEADFLVRSVQRPGEVVTDPARFHQIRQNHTAAGFSTWRWETVDA